MKLYKVAAVEVPPKSLVVITPSVAKLQLAPDDAVKTFPPDVTSLNDIALSDEPTTVNTVPEKLPATEPNDPAAGCHRAARPQGPMGHGRRLELSSARPRTERIPEDGRWHYCLPDAANLQP